MTDEQLAEIEPMSDERLALAQKLFGGHEPPRGIAGELLAEVRRLREVIRSDRDEFARQFSLVQVAIDLERDNASAEVLAEREACAKIADSQVAAIHDQRREWQMYKWQMYKEASSSIAHKIRSRTK